MGSALRPKGYKAVLFARDGDWVTDYPRNTKEEVIDCIDNQGSRWFFYPIWFIIRDYGSFTKKTQLIVDTPEGLDEFNRRPIFSVGRIIEAMSDDEFLFYIGGN